MRIRRLSVALGFGLGLGLGCAHEPGVYENNERQLIYDEAISTNSCERSCCENRNLDRGLSGTWNSSTGECSWHAEGELQLGCVNWCKRETKLER